MPQAYQGNYYLSYGYQHPQNMHYHGGPVYPPQYSSPSVLEAHAPWKDTDLAKFLTTFKTLKINYDGKNWSDYRFNFTSVCEIMSLHGFLDWLDPYGTGFPYPENDLELASKYNTVSHAVYKAIKMISERVEQYKIKPFSNKFCTAAETRYFLNKEYA